MPEESNHDEEVARYASLQDYLRVFRERWPLIVAVAVLGAAAAFAYSATQPKSYEASVKLSARQQAEDFVLVGESTGPLTTPQAKASELAALATRQAIAERTAQALGSDLNPRALQAKVSISIDVATSLVLVVASDEDPKFAADLANEYSEQIAVEATAAEREQITAALDQARRQRSEAKASPLNELQPAIIDERFNRLEALRSIIKPVAVVTSAVIPGSPVSPKPARNSMLGLLIGLFLGVGLAFARDAIDTRLKAPREMEEYFGIPRLGQLSEDAFTRPVGPQNGSRAMTPVDVESARIIRTNLEHLGTQQELRSIAVTSSLPGEGKSTVALALASVSAMSGRLTLLIECDLRQPVFADRLGLDPAPGLSDVLLGQASPAEALQVVQVGHASSNGSRRGRKKAAEKGTAEKAAEVGSRLVCLTAGNAVPNPAELLASEHFEQMLQKVTKAYEVVILDTSPLLSVVDTRELLPVIDGVVICARSYQTTREQARATREALDHFPVFVAGLVITGVRHSDDDYYTYYHRYAQPRESLVE